MTHLGRYALMGGVLSAAGLPLYIHAPKVYADSYGVSLASLGAVLFGLRLLDVVQDPLLGRLASALKHRRGLAIAVAFSAMGLGMLGLLGMAPPIAPLPWFALTLTLVFSAFSFLTICFYAQGAARGEAMAPKGHVQLARWRETGALTGVCLAAILPTILSGYAGFAIMFAIACGAATFAMRHEWQPLPTSADNDFGTVLKDPIARRLLLVALLNAAPVAVSSTLFLFFVESRLAAPGWEGPLLLVFFLSAAVAAPVWGTLAMRYSPRRVLLWGMGLAVASFSLALTLGPGDQWIFAIVCLTSGAALGADLTLLPALFSKRMAQIAPDAAQGFALWSFASKFTLALAAVLIFPLLDLAGFVSGTENTASALTTLSLLYAAAPCALKLGAMALLATTSLTDHQKEPQK